MKYVALLRGINVGGKRTVPMAQLRQVFADMGFTDVSTYINSGNVIFAAATPPSAEAIGAELERVFGFSIDTLVLSGAQVTSVAEAIPAAWVNDGEQKTDVAYLFADVDSADILTDIGYKPAIETMVYVPGAVIIHVSRKNQSKGSLLKMMGTPLYQRMTIRNCATARKLASLV